MSLKRSPALPDVPTVAELGYPGFEANTWFAVFAPARVPAEVLERLNAEIGKALAAEAVKERFAALSLDGQPMDRATLRRYLEAEVAKWGKVVKDNGLKAD
jgi:tripartite-type tricarboxylate transporter receptor subunit TctC